MAIAKDKLQHAVGGALAALVTLAVLWVAQRFGAPVAIGAAGTAVGWGFEWLQGFRGEGQPDPRDALTTSAGAWAVAAALQWLWPVIQRGIA